MSTQFLPRYTDPGLNHGDSLHYEDKRFTSQNTPVAGASLSSLRNTPRPYAYPVQHSQTPESALYSKGGPSFAEHYLKRKTPNGTISAAYDASPVDETALLPATKHILVSPIPHMEQKPSLPGTSYNAGRPKRVSRDYSPAQPMNNAPNHDGGLNSNQHSDLWSGSLSTEHPPTWQFPGSLDSVLNQTLPLHPSQRYYLQYGSTIPTVLPATTHAYAGPTVSVGSGLFGPYWPDGDFIPYRPAPIRDDRFYPHLARGNQPPYGGNTVPNAFPTGMHQPPQSVTHINENPYHTHGAIPNMSQPSAYRSRPVRGTIAPFHARMNSLAMPPHLQNQDIQHNSNMNSFGSFWPNQELPQTSTRLPDFNSRMRHEASTVAFKEKIFRWAHTNYVDLLTVLQASRKPNPYRTNRHFQSISRSNFYPKPPRHSSINVSDTLITSGQQLARAPVTGQTHTGLHSSHASVDNVESRPSTAIFSPHRRGSFQADHKAMNGSVEGRVQSFSDHFTDKHRMVRRTSGSYPLQTQIVTHDPSAAHKNASASLEMMERLCEESHDDWVEGMLLAGCLAYALGDHNKAMHWYQTILTRDSTHVEAMSNLAATLFALGRREEALNYWVAAVKLRPSYFEAVEHLIGLLSSNQRTREAVTIIELVERSLRGNKPVEYSHWNDTFSDSDGESRSRTSSIATLESVEKPRFDYDDSDSHTLSDRSSTDFHSLQYGNSGYSISASENGRLLALIHAKGNMLYALGDNQGAAAAFEDAIMIATGRRKHGIKGLILEILRVFAYEPGRGSYTHQSTSRAPILLFPKTALQTKYKIFPQGSLPGLEFVAEGQVLNAAIQTTSNSLLSLAKIYQDGMSNSGYLNGPKATPGVRDILALYYLSLSLLPSPSTANNVGILLAGVQQKIPEDLALEQSISVKLVSDIPGVVPGSGIHLALEYYNYGLNIDPRHAHLYTNLGSLLKDIGQLNAAIKMYEHAVDHDPNFDIALANLANAVKDQGRVADAIGYYRRAVQANAEFAEAVCGLATALNSVCGWQGRGGVYADSGKRDRFHVDDKGMLLPAKNNFGWLSRVVEIVEKQLRDGESWGRGTLTSATIDSLAQQLCNVDKFTDGSQDSPKHRYLTKALQSWSGKAWEGSRIVRLVERAIRSIGWQWYRDRYRDGKVYNAQRYTRPMLPSSLSSPTAPTVLPFHTFTAPLSAKQIRQISQRNGLRISVSTLRSSWLPHTVYPPPRPPNPCLNVGYVSSDFNNHPLAHLMQSVFGLHNPTRARAFCYATTASDNSVHRQQIEREAPVFYDASSWSVERLVNQIVSDGIHILINLNGYTRGARNEVFAARPAPIHMSFMGFAGTLGAEWCDYIYADSISIPPKTLSPWRRNVDIGDRLHPDTLVEDVEDWVYSENIIFARQSFFCCDHKQSAPDSKKGSPPLDDRRGSERSWEEEQARRWKLRKELFPGLSDEAVILGNFNQLYKIDPSTFRMYLRILCEVKNSVLWLLRFPDLGEQNLMQFAREWASESIAQRIIFTDVAPKGMHIIRASVVDLFLDTPECNAHTTAADVAWSGTPIITWGRWEYKMCSRMASSIVASALPIGHEGDRAREELIVSSESQYEEHAIKLAKDLQYFTSGTPGSGKGKLMDLRRMLWEGRWTNRLFDTKRWVRDLEEAYWAAWTKWERGEGGDIWL